MQKTAELKSILIKLMLGCLIIAAVVAVVTILVGSFNQTSSRALGTVASALVHVVILLGLISTTTKVSKNPALSQSSELALNSVIAIVIASFATSVFGIWDILGGDIEGKLYATYVIVLFAVLHTKVLYDAQVVYQKIKPYFYANLALILLVGGLLLGVVYSSDGTEILRGFYGRLLAASAIIDVTLSVIIAVTHRLYVQQHPELKPDKSGSSFSWLKIVIIIFLFFFVVLPVLGRLVFSFGF